MLSARNTFLNLAKKFPKWMDVHKRPLKSVGGKYLQSIVEEQNDIQSALNDFESDFFLVSYIGRENDIVAIVYVIPVGDVAIDMIVPAVSVTFDTREFLLSPGKFALIQNGFLILHPDATPKDLKVRYSYNGNEYGGLLTKQYIWNIFDEFAMFSGLSRYEDETNADLLKRCLLAFRNQTNSTEKGLKNAIINSVENYLPITKDQITFEALDENNLTIEDDDFGTLYEKLAQFNQDIFRTKKWDMDTWEHNFKQLEWVPHIWDAKIETYQDGTGQGNDIQVQLTSNSKDELTDVEAYGYVKSSVSIDEYTRKKSIRKKITLNLEQYKDELKATSVGYRITATDLLKIDPQSISIKSMTKTTGQTVQYLSDIVTDHGDATIVRRDQVLETGTYRLKFIPKNNFSDMSISKATYKSPNGSTKDLRIESGRFKRNGNVIRDTDVLLHATNTNQCCSYSKITNSPEGFMLEAGETEGEFSIDVTDMGGHPVTFEDSCIVSDITQSQSYVKSNGFDLTSENVLSATTQDMTPTLDIDIDCVSLSFDFLKSVKAEEQGSATVIIKVDGKVDEVNSGLWTGARTYNRKFSKLSRVQIHIQKAGMSPISFGNFKASRYEIAMSLEHGDFIHTPFATLIPNLKDVQRNILHVKIKTYSIYSPIVKYVHIGASLQGVSYDLTGLQLDAGGSLDIDSTCRVELYRMEDGRSLLLNGDYITKPLYRNDTDESVLLSLDVSAFETIEKSSMPISKTVYKGNMTSYVTLYPGETEESITITGKTYTSQESHTLAYLLGITTDEDVYVSKGASGFIVYNTKNLDERMETIPRSRFNSSADTFSYEGLPDTMSAWFSIEDTVIQTNKLQTIFDTTYITPLKGTEYIAYNTTKLLSSSMSNVQIVDVFYPLLDTSKLLLYRIEPDAAGTLSSTVLFEKEIDGKEVYEDWSFGRKKNGIRIQADLDYKNSSNYAVDETQVDDYYVISNNIELKDKYTIDGAESELARYIIKPPAGMDIEYATDQCGQNLICENDGFNKLWYSNVDSILSITANGVSVPVSEYFFLPKEGILVWTSSKYHGNTIQVLYSYKVPKYMVYRSIEALYDVIGYSIEAYAALNKDPVVLTDMHNGEIRAIDFGGKTADKILAKCTNRNYQVTITGSMVRTDLVSDKVKAIAKTGYYYDDGKEYYLFGHLHSEEISKYSNIELHNVSDIEDELEFMQKSTNHLLDTYMQGDREDDMCFVDFKAHKEIDGISRLESTTACDSYNSWNDFNVDISLVESNDGHAIKFLPEEDDAYAIMEISNVVKKNSIITFVTTGSVIAKIMREVKADGDSMSKSIFSEHYGDVQKQDEYSYFIFDDNTDLSYRYFLMIQGSGTIDCIIAKDYVAEESVKLIHEKQLGVLGFNVEEALVKNSKVNMSFDTQYNVLDNLELDKAGRLRTGSNVDYGVTKLFDSRLHMGESKNIDIVIKKNAFYSEGKQGTIVFSDIYLRNYQAITGLYVKVNDVIIDKMNNFNIRAYMKTSLDESYNSVEYSRKTNLLAIYKSKIAPYLQIEVEMPADRVINNIEIYARYAETGGGLFIETYDSGTFLSKVYDTMQSANYKLVGLDGTAKKLDRISLSMRGCRWDDNGHEVWTDWYPMKLRDDLTIDSEGHSFDGYQLFQFMIDLDHKDAEITIKDFILEVI
jgi:hypothetical protein